MTTLTPRFTYGDYRQWYGEDRWELIDGEAFAMSPAPARRHQQIVGGLFSLIRLHLEGRRCEVYVAPFDVRLPEGDEADDVIETVVQPDISVICDPSKLDDAGCRGAPDWIVEVLSPHTSARDQVHKRDLYERHGVELADGGRAGVLGEDNVGEGGGAKDFAPRQNPLTWLLRPRSPYS